MYAKALSVYGGGRGGVPWLENQGVHDLSPPLFYTYFNDSSDRFENIEYSAELVIVLGKPHTGQIQILSGQCPLRVGGWGRGQIFGWL